MDNYYGSTSEHGAAKLRASWHRVRDERPGYLVTLSVMFEVHSYPAGSSLAAAFPQARAVMDDWGNLVFVEAWH